MSEDIKFDKPVFTKKTDDKGREYFTAYANKKTNCVISLGKNNYVVEGNPKINMRLGKSKFDEEIFIELLKVGKIKKTNKQSNYDSIEIYFPKDFGLQFLKDAIKYFEDNLKE